MKRRLIARYRYLWTWELANAFIVFPIAVFVIGRHVVVSLSTVLALLALCSVLFAGAAFAFLKYRDLKIPNNTHPAVRKCLSYAEMVYTHTADRCLGGRKFLYTNLWRIGLATRSGSVPACCSRVHQLLSCSAYVR